MKKILKENFFNRPVLAVARDLLGKYLVNGHGKKALSFRILEVEAYDGEKDLANHASKGRTKRTEIMYGNAGYWYVYLCYGIHYMLNAVTGEKDYPSAVLIRGIEGANGPGKITRLLKISSSLNTQQIGRKSGFWIEDRGEKVGKIVRTPRIGVSFAGEVWSRKKYRFIIET